MFRAVEENRVDILGMLLAKGANPNVRLVRTKGRTVIGDLHALSEIARGRLALALRSVCNAPRLCADECWSVYHATYNVFPQATGQLPLETAATLGHRDILRRFVLAGANPGSGEVRGGGGNRCTALPACLGAVWMGGGGRTHARPRERCRQAGLALKHAWPGDGDGGVGAGVWWLVLGILSVGTLSVAHTGGQHSPGVHRRQGWAAGCCSVFGGRVPCRRELASDGG
jgi:hypothetical protein